MANLEGIGIRFSETMSGWLGAGEEDPRRGEDIGRSTAAAIRFDVEIHIRSLGRFLRDPNHPAQLTGTVTCAALGEKRPIRDGKFNLFAVERETGMRMMTYAFRFTGSDGQTYFLEGQKEVHDDPGRVDVMEDMTRLFTTIHRGEDESAPVHGAGVLYFKLRDLPRLVSSLEVENASSWLQRSAAVVAFTRFALGTLRDEYLKDVDPIYRTEYDNLVLSGELEGGAVQPQPFFLASGTHGIGFPWGDNEIFWDVLLAVGNRESGYERYAITDRVLEGLELDLPDGKYRYRGPLFRISDGYDASFHEMRWGNSRLKQCEAELELDFTATEHAPAHFPFPVMSQMVRRMAGRVRKQLAEWIAKAGSPGIKITPYAVSVRSGRFRLGDQEWRISPSPSGGEAEHGEFRNIKEPTLLYHYVCAPDPNRKAAHIQIRSGTLRDEKHHWTKDRFDKLAGRVINRTSSVEFSIGDGQTRIRRLAAEGEKPGEHAMPFRKIGPPVIEVNNDHFPTAVFQRRIVEVEHPEAGRCLALEEDVSTVRTGPVNCDREVRVASIRDDDKFQALDRVLEETGFDALVDARRDETGKAAAELLIAIKPNFMFAYNKRDRSTFTDPELVGHLAGRLRRRGYETIRVVEAQSSYGEYFTKRSVREMAEYLGFDTAAGYDVVDMTEDATEIRRFPPPLGEHPVSAVWRDADFRISFAKNKTHAYSYYTLTLKNIYGALPLANKFKEYHCKRGIYGTAIQYLKEFPVDYGLVDAFLSADGPFGIFADTKPNETHTIIGGADLVAVDWVAASKMGLDPAISKYMDLAIQEFGLPRIELIGDPNPYLPWLNVPQTLTLLTHKGMDSNHRFGNLLYTISAQMDESHFVHKSNALHVRLLRKLTRPLRDTFFVRTNRDPTAANRFVTWLLYRLGY